MKWNSDRYLGVAVGLALLLLVGAGYFVIISIRNLNANNKFVASSHEVIESLDALYSSIKDAEDASAHFVITGDDRDLNPYFKAQSDIASMERNLRTAIVNNVDQTQRLARLESAVSDRLEVFQQLIEVRRRDGQLAAEESIRTGKGQFLMEQIRSELNGMRVAESYQKAQREEEATRSAERAIRTFAGFLLIAVLVIGMAMAVTATSMERRKRVEATLRVTNQLHSAILDSTRYIIISTGTDGIIKTFNAAAEQWLGYSNDEVVGKSTPSIFHDPAEIQRRAQALSAELGTPVFSGFDTFVVRSRLKGADENEWTYVRKDGSRFPVQISVTTLREAEGRITGYLTVASDISERKQAEDAARESERRYRELVENSLGLICTHDLEGKLLSINKAAAESLGYTQEEMIGRNLGEFAVPETVAKEGLQQYKREIVEKGYHEGRLRAYTKDEQVMYWAYRNRLTRHPDGTPYVLGYAIDVTEQAEAEHALRIAEERYRDIFDNAGDMILSVTPEGRFQYVNASWCNTLGYSSEEALKLTILDVMPRQTQAAWNEMLTRALSGGETTKVESQFRARDGRVINVEGGISVKLEEGAPVALRAIFRDVSARKRHDQRIQVQLATGAMLATAQTMEEAIPRVLQTLCEQLNWELGEYWQLDSESAVLRITQSWSVPELERSVFQVASEKITYKMGRGMPGKIWETNEPVWHSSLSQDQDATRRSAARASNILSGWGVPIRAGNRLVGVMAFYSRHEVPRDNDLLSMMDALSVSIGQFAVRALRDAAIRDLNNLREVLLNSAAEGIYGVDLQGRATFVNPSAAEMLGYSPEELLGRKVHYVFHHSHAEGVPHLAGECPIHSSLRDGKRNHSGLDTLWRRNNSSFPVEYSSNPIFKDGRLSGAVITFRDITERRALDRMKDEFISTVSHELRTPLTSIRGSLGLLASGMLGKAGEKGQKMLSIAASNTDRLVRLINDILDIERMRSGRATLNRRKTAITPLMHEAAELMRPMALEAGVTIHVNSTVVEAELDPDRMIQVFSNLLSNAIKFSPRGGNITIEAIEEDGNMEATIRDQGRGIPPDKLEAIFARFQQVDASDSRQKGGTGLGLAIVRTIIEQHNGKIWAENHPEGGSVFHIRLPLPAKSPDVGEDEPQHRRKVVIYDEDAWTMSELTMFLERHQIEVLQAMGREDVIEIVQRAQPDAVILGRVRNLPDKVGLQEVLQQGELGTTAPVIQLAQVSTRDKLERTAGGWSHRKFDGPWLLGELSRIFGTGTAVRRVLLVEDDADLSRVLSVSFEQDNIEILHAINAAEARRICEATVPDLVVMDIILPGADGFSVVEWMKQQDRLRNLPLVIYSAREVNTEERDMLRLGPTDFMVKSQVSLPEVHRRVMALLMQRQEEVAHELKHAPTPTTRIQ